MKYLRTRAEEVKRGVLQAGGFPLELPAMSLSETFVKPTTMLYRNLMAMDTEEMLHALPVDAVVLIGGCDKTIPAQIMGAVSADVPALIAPLPVSVRLSRNSPSVKLIELSTRSVPPARPFSTARSPPWSTT